MGSFDRREFVGAVAAAGAGLATIAGRPHPAAAQQEDGRARVIRVRREDAVDDGDKVNAAVVKAMVDGSIAKLVGKNAAEEAWKALFGPDDVVTLKVNCLFGPGASTHVEVTDAVLAGLLAAGVRADNITVWDREPGHLASAGYTINDGNGVKVIGTGWEAQATTNRSFNGPLATILTREENTALVNVPVLKTHSICGMTLAMKNHYGSLKNPNQHHGNNCDPHLTDLNAVPVIRDRTRLIVADALRPVGEGGPSAQPQHTWIYGGILAAADPVAIDAVGAQILDEWRAARGMNPIAPKTRFLQTSEEAGLGIADLSKIDVIDL